VRRRADDGQWYVECRDCGKLLDNPHRPWPESFKWP